MDSGLSPGAVEQYAREGVLFPIRALSSAELDSYRSGLSAVERSLGRMFKRIGRPHLFFPWAYSLATHPSVVGAVSAILGPDVLVWGTLILSKPAHSASYVSWHQDRAYAEFLGSAPSLSAWIALSDSNAANGCMRVVPGSHGGVLSHREVAAPDNLLTRGQVVAADIADDRALDVALRAGEMSLHHINLVHGSNPNQSETRRIGFVVRFTTPEMRRAPFPVVRALGRADCSHLEVWNRPLGEDEGRQLADYAAYVRREEAQMLVED